jgi:transposase
MSRKIAIKEYNQGQTVMFPESIDAYIAAGAPVRLISHVVDKLDLSGVLESYAGGGCSCYNPRMMLKVLFYGYLNNLYSCRKIASAMERDIHFLWLSGKQFPKYNTINNFRSEHLKDTVNGLFTQVVVLLVDMGHLTLKEQYIDGTKMESRANKYTFVWKKSVEKNRVKLVEKIRCILQDIEEGMASDNLPDDEPPTPINPEELRKRIAQINRENKSKKQQKQIEEIENKLIPKLEEYEQKLTTCGERNSYSKTDPDATFMRLKEDAMNNGQTKPAYNLQIATENQFITNFSFYPNPTDTLTLIPFLNLHHSRYGKMPDIVVGDAGYGSERNYNFMESAEIEAFVKYNYFHKEQKRSFKNNAFLVDNFYHNEQEDYFICPMGQRMSLKSKFERTSEYGYVSQVHLYQAQRCAGCPLHGPCHKTEGNLQIEVNIKLRLHKRKAKERLTSEEGLRHRSRRPIEPEAVFGQMKANKHYKRFRHFGEEKITMDFAIFAIAFNIGKMWNKSKKQAKNPKNQTNAHTVLSYILLIVKNNTLLQKMTPTKQQYPLLLAA